MSHIWMQSPKVFGEGSLVIPSSCYTFVSLLLQTVFDSPLAGAFSHSGHPLCSGSVFISSGVPLCLKFRLFKFQVAQRGALLLSVTFTEFTSRVASSKPHRGSSVTRCRCAFFFFWDLTPFVKRRQSHAASVLSFKTGVSTRLDIPPLSSDAESSQR